MVDKINTCVNWCRWRDVLCVLDVENRYGLLHLCEIKVHFNIAL